MSLFYYCEKLGNAYVVGIGVHELAKFWFGVKDESESPLSQEKAEEKANELKDWFDKEYPVDSLDKEAYGDSETQIKKIRAIDNEDMDEFLKLMCECDCGA